MGDREDLVYQAKLAEQAERYDGKAASRGSAWDVLAAAVRAGQVALAPGASRGAKANRLGRHRWQAGGARWPGRWASFDSGPTCNLMDDTDDTFL